MSVGIDLRLSAEPSLTMKDREQRPFVWGGALQSCNPCSFEIDSIQINLYMCKHMWIVTSKCIIKTYKKKNIYIYIHIYIYIY